MNNPVGLMESQKSSPEAGWKGEGVGRWEERREDATPMVQRKKKEA